LLIVGLGNPGSAYANTRHNVGFMVIDELLSRHSHDTLSKAAFEGELFKVKEHFLLKPTTFMNLSGRSVATVKKFYKIDDVVVIHDDLDLPFGALRFKVGGGHGGHNGLKSTDAYIGKEYLHVRVGIGRPEHKGEVTAFVLGKYDVSQLEMLREQISQTADAVEALWKNDPWEDVASRFSIKKVPNKANAPIA
jgi:PTH1 family peptidyl-tRNA hydrolase